MAARTPVSAGTAGYVDPIRGCPEAPATPATTDVISTGYTLGGNRSRYISEMYFFSDVDDADTWASGITGIQIAFWAPNESLADASAAAAVKLSSVAGKITWNSEATASAGYLLLYIDPTEAGKSVSGRGL